MSSPYVKSLKKSVLLNKNETVFCYIYFLSFFRVCINCVYLYPWPCFYSIVLSFNVPHTTEILPIRRKTLSNQLIYQCTSYTMSNVVWENKWTLRTFDLGVMKFTIFIYLAHHYWRLYLFDLSPVIESREVL